MSPWVNFLLTLLKNLIFSNLKFWIRWTKDWLLDMFILMSARYHLFNELISKDGKEGLELANCGQIDYPNLDSHW